MYSIWESSVADSIVRSITRLYKPDPQSPEIQLVLMQHTPKAKLTGWR